MKTIAAVLVELGKPLEFAELEIPRLKSGQVLVEIAYSGLCHTQVLECRGYRGEDKFLPHCLGHEGSGTVLELGPGVSKVAVGQKTILSWMKGPGADVPSTTYSWNGRSVNSGAITTFSHHAVISENRLTPLPEGVSMKQAALLGCAVPTGFGSVFNAAGPAKGQSLAVFGLGGIGLCALQAARIAGCAPLIAVDIKADRLELARKLGATHVINAASEDPITQILKLAPKGIDFAIESSGRPQAMAAALYCVRAQGGTAVVIGNARQGEMLTIDPRQLNQGKRLLGTWGGDNKPERDFPRYASLVAAGKVQLEPLLEKSYSLEQANAAVDDLESGRAVRPVLAMGAA